MIRSWSNRAERIRPVTVGARLRLALAGSLALHGLIFALLTGPGNIGSKIPFVNGEKVSPDTGLLKRPLTARLSATPHQSRSTVAAASTEQLRSAAVIRAPDREASAMPPADGAPPNSASPPEPPKPTVQRDPTPSRQEPAPTSSPPSPVPPEAWRDIPETAAETAARRAAYLSAAQLDRKPGLLSEINIEYPESAGGQSGRVVLQLFIDEDGYVRETVINKAVPPGFFEQAVIVAFARARYSPGMLSGRAVKSQLPIEVDFSVFNRTAATSGRSTY